MSSYWEERLGSVIAGVGIVWFAAVATDHAAGFTGVLLESGPLEICGIGIVIWLHAKWRHSVRLH